MAVYTIRIVDFRPPSKNELFRRKLRTRMRLQKRAAEMIGTYALVAGVPPATGPRKVSVRITYPRGRRFHDVDAFYPGLLDALVTARLLLSDQAKHVRLGQWVYQTGTGYETRIRLRDLD